MTMLIRGFSQVETRSDNGVEAEMTPGGGTMTLRTRDVTLVASTRDMLHSLFGVAHPTIEDVDKLIDLVRVAQQDSRILDQSELLETLEVFRANLTACLRETDEGSYGEH